MPSETQHVHKRKSSKDAGEDTDIIAGSGSGISITDSNGLPPIIVDPPPPPRIRAQSTPFAPGHGRQSSLANGAPPSAGPYRTSFAPRPLNLNGQNPPSPYRSSFGLPMPPAMNPHSRNRSISTPFSPSSPSPLSSSFPSTPHGISKSNTSPGLSAFPPDVATSYSAPDASDGSGTTTMKQGRRHSRIHSRNLSIFFPRPGSLPPNTISEDGSQEVEFPIDEEAPPQIIPAAGTSLSLPSSSSSRRSGRAPITPLGQGFTFGARPPSSGPTPEFISAPSSSASSSTSRRGHHHKHSLSHNFFSFLEPGSVPPLQIPDYALHTQPTPTPVSPWGPMSAQPDSAKGSSFPATPTTNGHATQSSSSSSTLNHPGPIRSGAVAATVGQFILGAWMWVAGQQVGSLACTGLGYWVVFDSFGVGLSHVVPSWLASGSKLEKEKERIRRPYGNARLETVLMFAQAVYLMFSSVYVCKETVEHLLLSAGEGHHHHANDEDGEGIDFPIFMLFITFISLFVTAFIYENNMKLVEVTGNRIPSFSTLVRSLWSPSRRTTHEPPPTSHIGYVLSNPFVASPLLFCFSLLFVAIIIPLSQHRIVDLVLSSIMAVLTFKVAYRACIVLGTVLLQTSPPRGLSSGKMEAFLRAMREVERHPQVMHLPAPHIWQLSPSPISSSTLTTTTSISSSTDALVVTIELHVKHDVGDDDVLQLTKWAWERCVSALGSLKEVREVGEVGGPEVTVAVVRG